MNSQSRNSDYQQPNLPTAILAEQIKLLYQQANKALLATVILSTVLAFVFWGYVPEQWLLSWLVGIYLLTVCRFFLVKSYFRNNPSIEESIAWGRFFIIGVLLSGVFWGLAGGAFFLAHSAMHQLFLAYLLGGIIAGAMATLSSYRNAFLVFAVPTIIPFTYQAILHDTDTNIAIAFTYLLFLLLMGVISHRLHQTITHSLRLRFDNSDLLHRLLQAKGHQNAINLELQAQIAEKDLTQRALQNAKAQLEQRVVERTEALALTNDILHQEKELFQVTLASIGDAVITTDSLGKITYLNPIAESFIGWKNSEVAGTPLRHIFQIKNIHTQEPIEDPLADCLNQSGKSSHNQECRLIRRNRQECIIDYSVAPIQNNQKTVGAVLTFRDVTEQSKLTQKLAYQAAHDSLTGLLNRDEFEERLRKILASTRKNDTHALLYLDLDQFKIINDTCGHGAGDELLRQVTALLHSKLRARDTLARLGGDEFGVVLEHCPQNEAMQVANSLRELVQNFRFQWLDKTFTIGVSIGLYSIRQDNEGLAHVMSAADSACYTAKNEGRNRVHIYQANDNELQKKSSGMEWLSRIQQAIADKRLCLYFQPIIALSNKNELEEHGEFLLRLRDEQNQLILPGSFLSSAERHDQMLMIDRWVVEQSLMLLKERFQQPSKVVYAINLSAQALGSEDFLDFVVDNLKTYQKISSNICFEITENIALTDLTHVTQFIATLKELGCRFSMDRFGSGLSSFGYLKDIPLDYLKIDGRLIKNMTKDPVDQAVIESMNRIGHVLGFKMIAEWVEDAQTLQLLEKIGIDYVQGIELAEPHPFHSNTTPLGKTH
ncbi:MAG: EAL domain-containing protein [Nitrosomonas sp.]|nr:EAL domain-containing protein [Nitrosomonas sp.]